MLGIKVLQSHIDNGIIRSGQNCPLAKAIRDHFNNSKLLITVGLSRIIIRDDDYYYKLENGELSPLMEYNSNSSSQYWTDLSKEAQIFVWDFDRNWTLYRKVLPCEL